MENLINRAKDIVLQPKTTWEVIKTEETTTSGILTNYLFPLALVPAIASFIGYGFIGFNVGIFGRAASIEWGIGQAVTTFVSTFIGVIISAWVISQLGKNFGTTTSMNDAAKLVAYSYTPALIAGIFYLIPSLIIIVVLGGLYSLYLLYIGFQPMTNVSEQRKTSYFMVSLIAIIVVSAVLFAALGSILATLGLVGYQSINM